MTWTTGRQVSAGSSTPRVFVWSKRETYWWWLGPEPPALQCQFTPINGETTIHLPMFLFVICQGCYLESWNRANPDFTVRVWSSLRMDAFSGVCSVQGAAKQLHCGFVSFFFDAIWCPAPSVSQRPGERLWSCGGNHIGWGHMKITCSASHCVKAPYAGRADSDNAAHVDNLVRQPC